MDIDVLSPLDVIYLFGEYTSGRRVPRQRPCATHWWHVGWRTLAWWHEQILPCLVYRDRIDVDCTAGRQSSQEKRLICGCGLMERLLLWLLSSFPSFSFIPILQQTVHQQWERRNGIVWTTFNCRRYSR